MKILILTLDPPGKAGGVEGRAGAYAAHLTGLGHSVRVVSLEPRETCVESSFHGAKLTRLPSGTRGVVGAARLASMDSADAIFMLSGGGSVMGLLTSVVCRLRGRAAYIFFYGRDILQSRRRPYGRLLTLLSTILSRGVATNSHYTEGLLRLNTVRRVYILYPGVDPGIAAKATRVSEANDATSVLFVGRLVFRKGADILIEAFAQATRRHPGLRLEMVGDGPERARLMELTNSLGIEGLVTFHGELAGSELWGMYSGCDIFAMPSRATHDDVEGFGTVFLEAGLFGKPSIGSRTGGIPEAVVDGKTGILVQGPEATGVANAIETLLGDETARRGLGAAAQRRVLARYTWGRVTADLLNFLEGTPSGE